MFVSTIQYALSLAFAPPAPCSGSGPFLVLSFLILWTNVLWISTKIYLLMLRDAEEKLNKEGGGGHSKSRGMLFACTLVFMF